MYENIKKIKWCDALYGLSLLGIVLCLAACCFLLCSFDLIEARECSGPAATDAIRHGVFGELPTHIYLYGFLQPALLSLLPASVDVVMLHRCYAFCCFIASALPVFLAFRRLSVLCRAEIPKYAALLLCAIYLCPHLENMPLALATPAMQGLLITNLVLLLSLYSFRGKPLLLAVLVFAAWSTKAYFVFGAFYVFSSYFFLEQRKAVCVKSLAVFSITALSLFLLSLYHPQAQTMFAHCATQSGQAPWGRSLLKYGYFCTLLLPVLVFVPYLLVRYEIRSLFRRYHRPLSAQQRCMLFVAANGVFFTLLLLKIGGHIGMLRTIYHAQLLAMPYCLLFGVLWMLYRREMKPYSWLIPVFLLVTEGRVGYWFYKASLRIGISAPLEAIVQEDMNTGKKVCHSALTSVYEHRKTGSFSDNGQLQFVHLTYPLHHSYLQDNKDKATAFSAHFLEKLDKGEWDVIYTDVVSYVGKLPPGLLEKHYIKDSVYDSGLPSYPEHVTRWVKKETP